MKRREIKELMEEGSALISGVAPSAVEEMQLEKGASVYIFDGSPMLIRSGGILFPTLTAPYLDGLPSVVVDMGAVSFICNGADLMAPGVDEIRGDFVEGDLVAVRDVRHGKALAVGRALLSSERMRATGKGKVVKNLHHVSDELWQAYSRL